MRLYQVTYAKTEPGDDGEWTEYIVDVVTGSTGKRLRDEMLEDAAISYFSRDDKHYPYVLWSIFKRFRKKIERSDVQFRIVSFIDFGETDELN